MIVPQRPDTATLIRAFATEPSWELGLRVALPLLLCFAGWQVVKLIAKRIVSHASDHDEATLTVHEKRAQTVADLLRSVGKVVFVVLAILLTLNQFINLLPLLGGAAVLGLAVSFGAQSLVKDFLAGFFILVENQFAVGDVIEVAGKSGVVERMTLRVVMLRDLEGAMHIVPNGQITTVTNRTRGWARAVIDVDISYGSDVDSALKVLRDELDKFGKDPAWHGRLDGPPEVVGVEKVTATAITLRALIRTLPGKQWDAGREFRRRVKIRLDQENIAAPITQPTVQVQYQAPPEVIPPQAGGVPGMPS